jgi:hypothetical protein
MNISAISPEWQEEHRLHTRTFVLIRLGSDRPQIQVHHAQELGKPS